MKARKIFGRILIVLYIAAVAYLCFSKVDAHFMASSWHGIPMDKIAHFLMLLPFPFLMYIAFHNFTGRPWTLVGFLLIVIALGMLIGGGIELIQRGLDYRSADISDFRADNIGLAVGVLFTFLFGAATGKW